MPRENIETQILAISVALDETEDEIGMLKEDLSGVEANHRDDRVSVRAIVHRFERKLRDLEERLAKLERPDRPPGR